MRRSLKERTLVGTTKTYWQEVDEYYRKKGRPMRLDDVNECMENKRSIETAIGRMFDTDLQIAWTRFRCLDIEDAEERIKHMNEGFEAVIVGDKDYYYARVPGEGMVKHWYFKNVDLLVRPKEIRTPYRGGWTVGEHGMKNYYRGRTINEIFRPARYDMHGNLRPIIEDWPAVRDAAMRFISSVIK